VATDNVQGILVPQIFKHWWVLPTGGGGSSPLEEGARLLPLKMNFSIEMAFFGAF